MAPTSLDYFVFSIDGIMLLKIYESPLGSGLYRSTIVYPGGSAPLPSMGAIENTIQTFIITIDKDINTIRYYYDGSATNMVNTNFNQVVFGGIVRALSNNYNSTLRGLINRAYIIPYVVSVEQRAEIFALSKSDYKI